MDGFQPFLSDEARFAIPQETNKEKYVEDVSFIGLPQVN